MKSKAWGCWTAVLLYLVLRALMLYSSFDESALHMYEQYPMGTVPKMLLDGVSVPLQHHYDNAGGRVLVGLFALPLYAVLGPSYLALKLVPLLLGLGALLFAWSIADRAFGRRAANIAALIFAVGPTTLVKYSLLACGNHFENLFFTSLSLWAWYRLQDRAEPGAPGLFLAGLCSGFAIFVFLGSITTVALFAALHALLRGPRRALQDALFVGLGFAAGIAPLLWLNSLTHGRGLAFLDAKFTGENNASLGRTLARLGEFFGVHLPKASCYEDFAGLPGALPSWLFLAVFALAYAACAAAAIRSLGPLVVRFFRAGAAAPLASGELRAARLLPFVFYLPLTGVAFSASDLVVGNHAPPFEVAGYRYFLPHFLFAALFIAAAGDQLLGAAASWKKSLGALLLAAFAFTAPFNLALIDFSFARAGIGCHYPGYNFYASSMALIGKRNELSQGEIVELAERFPAPYRRQIYAGIGYHRALALYHKSPARAAPNLEPVLEGYPAAYRLELARGVGLYLRELLAYVPDDRAAVLNQFRAWSDSHEPLLEPAIDGFCQSWDFLLNSKAETRIAENEDWLASVPPDLQAYFARGLGSLCGRLLRRRIPSETAWVAASLARRPPQLREEFLQGLGSGLADGETSFDPESVLRSAISAEDCAVALESYSAERAQDR